MIPTSKRASRPTVIPVPLLMLLDDGFGPFSFHNGSQGSSDDSAVRMRNLVVGGFVTLISKTLIGLSPQDLKRALGSP
jgi:hypothetical protein